MFFKYALVAKVTLVDGISIVIHNIKFINALWDRDFRFGERKVRYMLTYVRGMCVPNGEMIVMM